ncbi:MAG: hypothetical protein Q8K59_08450 [Nitrosomonas sp.]|nr:hypothetical protein [Nitrosomonas sp.]MDP1951104.1 hypothetical protein [Nitrosomonas sp.]
MKYLFVAAIFAALTLSACGDPKPGQYPPSQYKQAEIPAEKIFPADDPVVPHAKSAAEEEGIAEEKKAEHTRPADDPVAPHVDSDTEEEAEEADADDEPAARRAY